ncbi:5,10-methylenetetrahydrofolate reductase [Anastrepha obliqua]|uniref:5,10-methylenetetrahydrofolate reductase n=1 Tax=Anastrepha obliqua TaxID=95512 RepID=UPI0024095F1B|nr:5,10-methylenetetrahydrofolate reductase [Anastrepha obliqua]
MLTSHASQPRLQLISCFKCSPIRSLSLSDTDVRIGRSVARREKINNNCNIILNSGNKCNNKYNIMHNPDYVPALSGSNATATIIGGHLPIPTTPTTAFQPVHVRFSNKQLPPEKRKLAELFKEKVDAKEFFYGIELSARSYGKQQTMLDYDKFDVLLPLFTSLVWLGQDYANIENVTDVDAISLGRQLYTRVVVMPHLTCFRADSKRLDEFLKLNFTNVLALRGDQVDPEQQFPHAKNLVEYIRNKRGDTISIGVAGYPEGHPESKSMEEDMQYLKEKVDAGADFIITQICFSPESIVRFVQNCRANGITVPIIIGIVVPDNMRILQFIMNIVKAVIPAEQLSKYKELENNPKAFRAFAVENAVRTVRVILESDLNIYGFQFFTMNRLKNVQLVIRQILDKNGIESK